MQREIKFRAWLKETKDMVTVFHWHKGDVLDCIEVLASFNGSRRILADQYDLMQYIGLKDKNGVEIYEGDVINDGNDNAMIVNWNEKFASFCLDRDGWAFSHWFGESTNPQNVEVIGNIHQNPELLK